ncbi:pyridoxamine 5'-phosphate oxidase family protein [Segatella buccae]|uniref:pyridoxamine 5'-phosphate oxidase family protein n=1 Tax=Segatella buccae TaxID=28126 RepID=UPI00248F3D10|nr:pyridoxamine 5'-phosphate oxidase family protein [Segatella buccae]
MTEFRPMRRKRQQLSEQECMEILEKATSGVLSVLGDGGYPYGVPISYVVAGGKLYFHSALKGHKVDAVRGCDKASFTVIDRDDVKPKEFTTYFRSVVCFGRVRLIEDDAEKLDTLRKLGERYNLGDEEGIRHEIDKDFSHLVMLEFAIEHLSGKEAIELVRMKRAK